MMQTLRNWADPKSPWKIWAIPIVLITPAIFLIPADVFTQYSWAKGYTDFIASLVPMIDRTAHLHPQPDKFRAFYAYAWSWFPLFLLLAYVELKVSSEAGHLKKDVLFVKTFVAMLIIVWVLYVVYFAPGDGGFSSVLMTKYDPRSRLYRYDDLLAVSAPFMLYAAAVAIITCKDYVFGVVQELKKTTPK